MKAKLAVVIRQGGLARVVVAAVHIMMVVKMAKVALKSEMLAKMAVAAQIVVVGEVVVILVAIGAEGL